MDEVVRNYFWLRRHGWRPCVAWAHALYMKESS
jgi:hypothetical protein